MAGQVSPLDPWTQGGIQNRHAGPQGPPGSSGGRAWGSRLLSPPQDALLADTYVLRAVRTAGTSGTLYGTRAGGERTGFLLPSVIPRLPDTALLPGATTLGPGRPHPQPLLDPRARVGGPLGAVTPLHSPTTPHSWPRAPPRHAGAAASGEQQRWVNCES